MNIPWDAVQWGDAAAWIAIAASVVMSGLALRLSRNANREAKRSADASERSAAASERSADAADRANELAEAAARYEQRWVLGRTGDATFTLTNDTDEDAFEVEIEVDGSLIGAGPQTIAAQDTIPFSWQRRLTSRSSDIVIYWRRSGEDDPREWRGVLPG
jgi:type II secretory pathway pseudopilin PulG